MLNEYNSRRPKRLLFLFMDNIEQKLKDLRKKRDSLMTSFFWLGLQIAFIFAVPAALGAFLGTYLDKGKDKAIFTTIFLVCAFVVSWVMVYFRYKKYSRSLEAVETEIADIKKELPVKDNS